MDLYMLVVSESRGLGIAIPHTGQFVNIYFFEANLRDLFLVGVWLFTASTCIHTWYIRVTHATLHYLWFSFWCFPGFFRHHNKFQLSGANQSQVGGKTVTTYMVLQCMSAQFEARMTDPMCFTTLIGHTLNSNLAATILSACSIFDIFPTHYIHMNTFTYYSLKYKLCG